MDDWHQSEVKGADVDPAKKNIGSKDIGIGIHLKICLSQPASLLNLSSTSHNEIHVNIVRSRENVYHEQNQGQETLEDHMREVACNVSYTLHNNAQTQPIAQLLFNEKPQMFSLVLTSKEIKISTVDLKTCAIGVTSDKEQETNLKETNKPQSISLLTCTVDDLDAALETNELEEEMHAGQELSRVMKGADDVPRDNPINKVDLIKGDNMAVCCNFKAYQGESDDDQTLLENEVEAADISENHHKEKQEKEDNTTLIDDDVCQFPTSLAIQ